MTYVLRDCSKARNIWQHILVGSPRGNSGPSDLVEWLFYNLKCTSFCKVTHIPWYVVFVSRAWHIWKERNNEIFNNIHTSAILLSLIFIIMLEPFPRPLALVIRNFHTTLPTLSFPAAGDIKLNTNGSNRGNPGASGIGGLLRDSNGQWIVGYCGHVTKCTSLEAELLSIQDRFNLVLTKDLQNVIIESDAKAAIELIKANDQAHPLRAIIEDCRVMLHRSGGRIIHTLREGNKCADFLAKLGVEIQDKFTIFESPPIGIG